MTKTSIHSPFWAHCTSCLCSLAKAEKNLIVGILGFVKLVFAFPLMGKHTLSDWQLAHTPFTRDGIWVKECWCVKCRCTIHDFTSFPSTYFGEGIPINLKNGCSHILFSDAVIDYDQTFNKKWKKVEKP